MPPDETEENLTYPINPISAEEHAKLDNTFSHHVPQADQPLRYKALRVMARSFAELILHTCPPSRERSVALTELETCLMWASASIARNS